MPDTPEQAYESILGKCRPLDGPERQPGTFEIGLVLAGAVSAGAYTAGVLDFLIEALEAWYADKQDGKDVPRHEIKIRVIAGASAGAITGAITATALRYQFPHCRASSIPTVPGPTNPLFDAWVEDIDIRQLLTQNDLADGAAPQSLLDSTCLSRIAAKAIDYAAAPFTPRPYLADPLKLIFTVTNLRGVPYSITMKGNAADGHCMTAHADWLRFAVVGLNGGSSSNPALCPDDILLTYPNSWALQAWQDLGHAALASGAFPFGLQPRMIIRPIADYHYRYTIVPGDAGKPPSVAPLAPCWPATVPGPDYGALHVDGGAMNNEPLELARRELAGPRGRNPREGDAAHRAVVMVDPFPDPAELGPNHPTDLVGTAASLFVAWKEQARFTPEEIALAQDESIFSRFLISPSRGNGSTLSGGFALASGALGGFSGFLHRQYRLHDYLLGRRNCQQFLQKHFTLPDTNPLFALGSAATGKELPIIPLVRALATVQEPLPAWPVGVFSARSIRDDLGARLKAVVDAQLKARLGWWTRHFLKLAIWLFRLRKRLLIAIVDKIDQELRLRKLLP